MELEARRTIDLDETRCPHCPGQAGLDLVLRVELETERAIYMGACPTCRRVYRVEPGGRQELREIDLKQLTMQAVTCPECGATGYALGLEFPREHVESYSVLTCADCRCTFRSDHAGMH